MTLSALQQEYISTLPILRSWGLYLSDTLGEIPRVANGIVSISWRVKKWEAIKEKLKLKNSLEIRNITDLIGVRIIVSKNTDVFKVVQQVSDIFGISEIIETEGAENFQCLHLLIRLKYIVKNNARFSNLVSELQIMTVAQDAALKIKHELSYAKKQESDIKIEGSAAIGLLKLEKIISQFEALISSNSIHEKKDIHPFLIKNPFLVHNSSSDIKSEVQIGLGAEYKIDFVVRMPDSSYFLVEIENPKHKLFTKKGDFSSAVNHAVRQVEDWQEWIENNLSTVQTKYPGLISPEGIVIIGRSNTLTISEQKKLSRRNINSRGKIKIITYDNLLLNAKTYIDSIKRDIFKSVA